MRPAEKIHLVAIWGLGASTQYTRKSEPHFPQKKNLNRTEDIKTI